MHRDDALHLARGAPKGAPDLRAGGPREPLGLHLRRRHARQLADHRVAQLTLRPPCTDPWQLAHRAGHPQPLPSLPSAPTEEPCAVLMEAPEPQQLVRAGLFRNQQRLEHRHVVRRSAPRERHESIVSLVPTDPTVRFVRRRGLIRRLDLSHTRYRQAHRPLLSEHSLRGA